MQVHLFNLLASIGSLVLIGLIVLSGQFLFKYRRVKGEYVRKFVHMAMAIWIASWRLFLPQIWVVAIALVLAAGVIVAKRFKVFNSVHAVRRATYGEMSYAIAIALAAILFSNPAVYALAIINLGFADGLAAIVGTRYGKKKYKILGATKTAAGFVAAFLFAVLSGAIFWQVASFSLDVSSLAIVVHILLTAGLVAVAELLGQKGLDNILIPLATGFAFIGLVG